MVIGPARLSTIPASTASRGDLVDEDSTIGNPTDLRKRSASLLPVMVTVLEAVPSWLKTVKLSCTCWPAVSSSWAPLPA